MHEETSALKERLLLSLSKTRKDGPGPSVSVALSKTREKYYAGSVDSDTNLLDFSSEQCALLLSIQQQDFSIIDIVTLVEKRVAWENLLSPLVVKVLSDYSIRTGNTLSYTLLDREGTTFFSTKNVLELTPYYKPTTNIIEKTKGGTLSSNTGIFSSDTETVSLLRKYSREAIARNFPTYDSASGYGAVALTADGSYFQSGQYGSFEKRLNIHAEMGALISTFMNHKKNVIALGVAATKFKESPCEICGCCRQFLAEMSTRFDLSIAYYCFSLETDDYKQYTLEELLPHPWMSLKK